jgi:NADH-quinone oxidoreductase subunit K
MLYVEKILAFEATFYLPYAVGLFLLGLIGIVFNKRSLLILMLCIELMFLGISFTFIIFALVHQNTLGEVYALLVLSVAAAESAIGLGLLVIAFRVKKSITFSNFNELHG